VVEVWVWIVRFGVYVLVVEFEFVVGVCFCGEVVCVVFGCG